MEHLETGNKEKSKKIREIIKSQKRLRVLYECLHTPYYPMCLVKTNKNNRYQILRQKFQLNQTILDRYDALENGHRRVLEDSKLTVSKLFHNIPCYFNAYFCNLHQPMNPNIIKRVFKMMGSVWKQSDDKEEGNSQFLKRHQKTTYITPKNFNINNPYRISMLEEFWKILNNKFKNLIGNKQVVVNMND